MRLCEGPTRQRTLARVSWLGLTPEGGGEQTWLFAADGSWSVVDERRRSVEQHGPRALWDEVELTHAHWEQEGEPSREQMGLTVGLDGAHLFWLDKPTKVISASSPMSDGSS
jgi:hypothetical protein